MSSQQEQLTPQQIIDQLGKRRFRTDSFSDNTIKTRAQRTANVLLSKLPSNYGSTTESSIGSVFRLVSEEVERYYTSLTGISQDKYFDNTRPEMLYQNLASYLFLGPKALGSQTLTDEQYRSFLLKVRDAYLRGSSKDSIEESLADILGLTVVIKELFLEARLANSPYSVKDTHKLVCEILMDGSWDRPVGDLLQDVSFYTSLIKPAHTLLENRLVWAETVGISGGCYPGDYLATDANGAVHAYPVDADPQDPSVFLVRMMAYAGSDSPMVEGYVPGAEPAWVSGTIDTVNLVNKTITLEDGITIFTGLDSLFYSHDFEGDYRIIFSDITPGSTVQYQAITIPGLFQFYRTPLDLVGHPERAFDKEYNQKPDFQENVVKTMDAQGRFPELVSKCHGALADRWVTDVLEPLYEDLRDDCSYPTARPYSSFVPGVGATVTVNNPQAIQVAGLQYVMDPHPIMNNAGELAAADDIVVYLDGAPVTGWISSLDPVEGTILLSQAVPAGSLLRLDFFYSSRYPAEEVFSKAIAPASTTTAFPDMGGAVTVLGAGDIVKRLYWPSRFVDADKYGDDQDMQVDHFPILNVLGELATVSDLTLLVNGTEVPGGIISVKPLLGHVRLSFIPAPGSALEIRYYYTEKPRSYALVPDDESCTMDAEYGNDYGYSLVPDYPDDFDTRKPVQSSEPLKKVGIRYRAYQLASSSVLNSEDTLSLNTANRPAGIKASLANSYGKIGQQSLVFSPEHLKDKSRYINLDDNYLQNGLAAETQLLPGVPTFQSTFTDRSGLIKHKPLSDIRDNNGEVLMYSDLHEFRVESGRDANLSSICDSRGFDLALTMDEEYFPNREMRLNDYMDYVSKITSTLVSSGKLSVINGSDIIKSDGTTWMQIPVGALVLFEGHTYTVAEVRNRETIRLTSPVSAASGEYTYSITMESAPDVKVNLNDLVRKVDVNISSFQSGYTPSVNDWVVTLDFPDPDPDPYPRTADNVNYPTPTAPLLIGDIHDDSGARDLLLDEATASKLVKWRNWDQAMFVTGEKVLTDVDPLLYPDARVRPGGGTMWDLYDWKVYLVTNVGPLVPSVVYQELVGY